MQEAVRVWFNPGQGGAFKGWKDVPLFKVAAFQNITRAQNKHRLPFSKNLSLLFMSIVQLWVWEPQLQRQVLPTDWEYTTHAAVFYLSLCLQCVRSHVINVWASVMIRMWWSSRLQPCSGWNCSHEYFFSSIKVGYNLWKCCLESFPSAFRQQITSSNYQTMCTGTNYLDGNFGFGFCSIRAITPIMSPLYA